MFRDRQNKNVVWSIAPFEVCFPMQLGQACPRVYPRITRIRTREIRIPTDHSLWVTHRRSPKLARGHSRSRGKADFTFNSESRHRAQWARGPCCPFISIQGHMCTAACTATDWRPSLITPCSPMLASSLSLAPSSSSLGA
jgi:hypothetical protein